MRHPVLKVLAIGLCLSPLSLLADAEMFRPFEPYIDAKFGVNPNANETNCRDLSCIGYNREKYKVVREPRSEYWRKQRYYNRHCGSAYVNCIYPDEDYPRYNGRQLDLRWWQRQPYYPPFR